MTISIKEIDIMKIKIIQDLGIKDIQNISAYKTLCSRGHEIVFSSFDEDAHFDADVLIVVNSPLDRETLQKYKNLKMVSIAFTGFDHVDTKYCKEKVILVSNSAGYSTYSVSELTFGLILSLYRHINTLNESIREGKDKTGYIGNDIFGKTIGIIGTGEIGSQVAKVAKALGCNLLGYSRTEKKELVNLGMQYKSLEDLLKESDIVSVHTPLNQNTKDLINANSFELMKDSSILIQTSRGGTVNENDLLEALKTGKIAGAGIDVFSTEPPLENNPLINAPNTVLTPHIAYATHEALDRRAEIVFENIIKWIEGNPQNIVR